MGLDLDQRRNRSIGKTSASLELPVAFLLPLNEADHGMGCQSPQVGPAKASKRAGMIPPVQNIFDHGGHGAIQCRRIRPICMGGQVAHAGLPAVAAGAAVVGVVAAATTAPDMIAA